MEALSEVELRIPEAKEEVEMLGCTPNPGPSPSGGRGQEMARTVDTNSSPDPNSLPPVRERQGMGVTAASGNSGRHLLS